MMFGTIARLRVAPGKMAALREIGHEVGNEVSPLRFQYVFQSADDPDEVWLVVGFDSREAYERNAESPEQHQRFLRFRELLTADPEWHDGALIDSLVR